MIGSDHRYSDGSAPARSDTLMLVRMDPRTHLISLLSLPRDLWVNIPGFGQDKINAAYSDGGPKVTLETVKELTGLHVNYLIGVNFHSFVSLVNNLGGVYIPVDEAYIHTEAANNALPPGERWSVINLLPGYQLLNGTNALAFSRFRHTDSDFYRNARQQTFLHAFEQKVSARFHGISLSDLGTIRSIIDTISGNVDVAGANGGIGIQTMIRYATLAYASRGHLVASRLQAGTGMIGAASVVEATPEAMKQAVYAFTHPQNIASPTNQLPQAPTIGPWKRKRRFSTAVQGKIAFRFHARDLHLVLGPGEGGKPVRYRVTIDGKPPMDDHGVDTDADGAGMVTEQRLYQLVRLSGPVGDHTFEIEILDPEVEAYSFTFGVTRIRAAGPRFSDTTPQRPASSIPRLS